MHPLQPVRVGNASALVVAVLWVICSAVVLLIPGPATWITAQMLHVDPAMFQWQISAAGFAVGLLSWTALAWVIAASATAAYRLMASRRRSIV